MAHASTSTVVAATGDAVVSRPHSYLAVNNTKYEKNCEELYLANQGIQKIANFEGFVNLNFLYLHNNKIKQLTGLEHNFRLKGLYLANNQITTLMGSCIGELRSLERLDLSNNLLKALESTIEQLVGLSRLESLDLYGNALADVLNYRFYVIYRMPWLHLLDCHEVTDEQRVTAKRLFGTPEENAKTIPNTAFGFTYRPGGVPAPSRRPGTLTTEQWLAAQVKEEGPSLYDDLCREVDRIKRKREDAVARKLKDFYAASRPSSGKYAVAMPPPPWLEPPGINERLTSNLQNLEIQLELRRVFSALDPAGKAIERSQARAAVQAMQFTHRPDAAALEAVLGEWDKGTGKLSLKDFSVGISTIATWTKRSKHDCIVGAKALRKQAEELVVVGKAAAARELIAVAHRLDPRMQAPLEPPEPPAPKYEFPPHMMKDTYQSLRLDYHADKVKSDVRALAREFQPGKTVSSPVVARTATSSGALPAAGAAVAVHDANRLQTHILASSKHNKPNLYFATHNLCTNAPHPPLYIAGDDYFNKTLPHRHKLEPANAYSGTATLRPIRSSSSGQLGRSGAHGVGTAASPPGALKSQTAVAAVIAKAGRLPAHGNAIEPEDLVSMLPKQFDFDGSDDECDSAAPAEH